MRFFVICKKRVFNSHPYFTVLEQFNLLSQINEQRVFYALFSLRNGAFFMRWVVAKQVKRRFI